MKPYSKYDPEDIESLLLHKQFHELYPEEKEFILQHIETPEEYDSLRKTLFELRDAANDGTWLEPDASLKKDLMSQFASEEKGGFRIWLNSLFAWPDVQWYRQPALRVAFAGACVLLGVLFFINYDKNEPVEFAENRKVEEQKSPETDTIQTKVVDEEKNLFAENITPKELPPAPAPTAVVTSASRDVKYVEPEIAEDVAIADSHAEKDMEFAPPPAIDNLATHKSEEKVSASEMTKVKKEADNTNEGNAVTFSAPTITSNSVTTNKAISSNIESVRFASANSKPVSEVNDLLSYLFTAQ